MKKIICLIDCLDSGGAQRQLIGLAILLKSKGYNVTIVDYSNITFWDSCLLENKIPFHHLDAKTMIGKIVKVFLFIVKFNPGVVIAYLDNPCSIASVVKLVLHGKFKLIVSDRNTDLNITRHVKNKFFFYRFADWIVPNSFSQGDIIKDYNKKLIPKMQVITNFVDTNVFVPNYETSLKTFKPKKRFLVVGRIASQKNALGLLKGLRVLASKRTDFIVEWFGRPNPESYYKLCLNYISENPILKNIIAFHDHVKNIKDEYTRGTALLLPSYYEGFPNVICEAMSCGLPILCSNVCDNSYLVKHEVNGLLFDPYDEFDICDKLNSFLDFDDDKILEMAKKNRRFAEEYLAESVFIDKYIDLIGEK